VGASQPKVSDGTQRKLIDIRPESPEELFNLRHSSARNVIERIFGVVKNRFKILDRGCNFDIHILSGVVLALCALHNSIREYSNTDMAIPDPFPSDGRIRRGQLPPECHIQPTDEEEEDYILSTTDEQEKQRMIAEREKVAQEMWVAYQSYRLARHMG